MQLPVLDRPRYQTNLLSRKDPVDYVPFTVKESKILLMAKESENVEDIINALAQILGNCLMDKSINVKELPLVDLEWLFLQIWSRSSGEKVPLYFKCKHQVPVEGRFDPDECGMIVEFEVDLLKVEIQNKEVNRKIMINDKVGLMMKLPTFEITQKLTHANTANADQTLAALCIEYVFDENSMYYSKDATPEEMVEFVESLPIDKYEQVERYFENCPTIKSVSKAKCEKCGFEHEITLEGLEDFFE